MDLNLELLIVVVEVICCVLTSGRIGLVFLLARVRLLPSRLGASLVFNVVGQKIKKMNKWINIKIQKNKMIQKEIMNKIQRPNRNERQNIL